MLKLVYSLLVLAGCTVESTEAGARTITVVADAPSRAVPSRFIPVPSQGVIAAGTFLEVACGSPVAHVTQTSHVLHRIPRVFVDLPRLLREVFLGPTSPSAVAIAGTGGALTGDALVASEARTQSNLPVAQALVAALGPRVKVIGIHHFSHPSYVLGTCSQTAVGTGPFGLAVQTNVAVAVLVEFTRAVT